VFLVDKYTHSTRFFSEICCPRISLIHVAFDGEVGAGKNDFNPGRTFSRLALPDAVNAAAGTGHHVLLSLDGDFLAKNGAEDSHF
jgi:hypothetical protein